MFTVHQTRYPTADLKPFVKCYLEIRMGEPGEPLGCRLPAKLEPCIFFSTDTVATIATSANGNVLTSADTCCYVRGGVKESMLMLHITGVLAMFVVIFKPSGFFRLFNIPANHVVNTFIPAAISIGQAWEDLGQLIRETGAMDKKVVLAEQQLLKLLRQKTVSLNYVDEVIATLQVNPGLSVVQMAQQSFLSERQFRRRFIERTGLEPRTFARICRGNLAIQRKKTQPDLSWRSIAFDMGYSDQSHFRKEMKLLMGLEHAILYADKRFIDVQGTHFKMLEPR